MQFATNHLGHFALAVGLHDALAAAGGARIVSVSSGGHLRSPVVFDDIDYAFRDYDPFGAYGQSKTANVLFAVEATRRWASDGIFANALMPGGIATPLQRHLPAHYAEQAWRRSGRPGPTSRPSSRARRHRCCWRLPRCWTASAAATSRTATRPCGSNRRGRPGQGGVAPYALDPANAERLWELSLKLTRISHARGRHRLAHRRQPARGAGRKSADPLRHPGAALRHRRPDRPGRRRGGQPRQAPVHPGGPGQHPLASEDGRQLEGRPVRRPSRAGHRIRIILEAGDIQAAGIDLGVLEVLDATTKWTWSPISGPTCSATTGIRTIAAANLIADPDRPLAEALLDQRVMAGVGNVYCNELCFVIGHLPTAPVSAVQGPAADGAAGRDMLWLNRSRSNRTTTGDTRRGRELWVYGRAGQPCRRCGTADRVGQQRRPGHVLVPGLSAVRALPHVRLSPSCCSRRVNGRTFGAIASALAAATAAPA